VREINDEINKLNKTKQYWDERILELGGGDNTRRKQFYDVEGKELPGAPGYKYYGAAKDLPGVRELFREKDEEAELRRRKRTRADMYKNITPDYYGYRDEDDVFGTVQLALLEDEGEEENVEDVKYLASLCDKNIRSAVNDSSVKAHVDVPSQDQIGAIVVDERKRLLLEKFNILM
jgi:pre-mRNA-splicing factor ISY1